MAAEKRSVWLFSPAVDMLLGYGGLYLLLVGVLLVVPLGEADVGAMTPWLVLLLLTPHYGATLVRVYGSAESRRKYRFFAVYVTLVVIAGFVAATRSTAFGSWFWTIQVTWGLYHYAAQNYGVTLMALGRADVQMDQLSKRVLKWSFLLATLVAVIPFNIEGGGGPRSYTASALTVHFVSLRIPESIGIPFFWGAVIAYAAFAVAALALAARKAKRLGDLVPSATLMAAQAVWFAVPAALMGGRSEGPTLTENPALAMIWVAVGHAIQYLWITVYFARKSDKADAAPLFFAKAIAAGGIAWFLPPILFAPGALGSIPFDLGLALVVSAAVNVHHYILDGVIWKLRDGRLARILLNSESETATASAAPWSAKAVIAVGLVLFASNGGAILQAGVQHAAVEARDADGLEESLVYLTALGRDSPKMRITLGQMKKARGDTAGAAAEFETSLDLFANPLAWVELGLLREDAGQLDAALEAYEAAAQLDATLAIPLVRSGIIHLKRGASAKAASDLERARSLQPNNPAIADLLSRARQPH